MQKPSGSNTDHHLMSRLLLGGGAFLLILLAGNFGIADPLNRLTADFLIRSKVAGAPLPLSSRVVCMVLDDRAEKALSPRVDDRSVFADLAQLMAQGRIAGGMDILFRGSRNPLQDARLAEALSKNPRVVLAVLPVPASLGAATGLVLSDQEKQLLRDRLWHPQVIHPEALPRAESFLLPAPPLLEGSRMIGHITAEPDSDGLYRRVNLFYRWEDGLIPSLSLAMAAGLLGFDPADITVEPGLGITIPLRDGSRLNIPMDQRGSTLVPYPAPWKDSWPQYPLDKLEDGLLDEWEGAAVLTADLTTGKQDFGSTAFDPVYPLAGLHAALVNGMITGAFYSDAGPEILSISLFGAFLMAVTMAFLRKSQYRTLLWLAGVAMTFLTSWIFWLVGLVILSPWVPAFGLTAGWITLEVFQAYRTTRERRLLGIALSRYFPRPMAEKVLKSGNEILTPERKTLTILFADVVGFSTWSSDKDPEFVHATLSEYLGIMTQVVFDHHGTVDKFMGDGILAFFGDPFEQPDHGVQALSAAVEMQKKAAQLKAKWMALKGGLPLEIRVGLNTGEVVVGNLGSEGRVEYTVIGSAVNLAQRMEGLAGPGGILLSDTTRQAAGDTQTFDGPTMVIAKGFEAPVKAWKIASGAL